MELRPRQDVRLNISILRTRSRAISQHALSLLETSGHLGTGLYGVARDFLTIRPVEPSSIVALFSCELAGGADEHCLDVGTTALLVRTAVDLHRMAEEQSMPSDGDLTSLVILAGDLMLSEATRIMGRLRSPVGLVLLGEGLRHLVRAGARGEACDATTDNDSVFPYGGHNESGILAFAGSCAVSGALVAGWALPLAQQMRPFGRSFAQAIRLTQLSESESSSATDGMGDVSHSERQIDAAEHLASALDRISSIVLPRRELGRELLSVFDVS